MSIFGFCFDFVLALFLYHFGNFCWLAFSCLAFWVFFSSAWTWWFRCGRSIFKLHPWPWCQTPPFHWCCLSLIGACHDHFEAHLIRFSCSSTRTFSEWKPVYSMRCKRQSGHVAYYFVASWIGKMRSSRKTHYTPVNQVETVPKTASEGRVKSFAMSNLIDVVRLFLPHIASWVRLSLRWYTLNVCQLTNVWKITEKKQKW